MILNFLMDFFESIVRSKTEQQIDQHEFATGTEYISPGMEGELKSTFRLPFKESYIGKLDSNELKNHDILTFDVEVHPRTRLENCQLQIPLPAVTITNDWKIRWKKPDSILIRSCSIQKDKKTITSMDSNTFDWYDIYFTNRWIDYDWASSIDSFSMFFIHPWFFSYSERCSYGPPINEDSTRRKRHTLTFCYSISRNILDSLELMYDDTNYGSCTEFITKKSKQLNYVIPWKTTANGIKTSTKWFDIILSTNQNNYKLYCDFTHYTLNESENFRTTFDSLSFISVNGVSNSWITLSQQDKIVCGIVFSIEKDITESISITTAKGSYIAKEHPITLFASNSVGKYVKNVPLDDKWGIFLFTDLFYIKSMPTYSGVNSDILGVKLHTKKEKVNVVVQYIVWERFNYE